jgi:hypothetical protein
MTVPRRYERTLLLASGGTHTQEDVIAIASIDTVIPECVLRWPLWDRHNALAIIEAWINEVLPYYFDRKVAEEMRLEYWLQGAFHETIFRYPFDTFMIQNEIAARQVTLRDRLELLLLNYNDVVMELDFSQASSSPTTYAGFFVPTFCACVFREAYLGGMVRFFMKFHASRDVRSNSEITLRAFHSDSTIYPDCLKLLDPLPVIP